MGSTTWGNGALPPKSELRAASRGASPDAILLLLELADQLEPSLSALAARIMAGATQELVQLGYLVRDGDDRIASVGDDHQSSTVFAEDMDGSSISAWHEDDGLVPISHDSLQRWRVNWSTVLLDITREFQLPKGSVFQAIVPDFVWDLGFARVGSRKQRHSVWFVRCLAHPQQQKMLRDVAGRRPPELQRIVLTTTPASRLPREIPSGHSVVSLEDVIANPRALAVSSVTLDYRLGGRAPAVQGVPLDVSDDGRVLTVNGTMRFTFNTKAQRRAIGKLLDGYRSGKPVRTRDLGGGLSMDQFFGLTKWKKLRLYLERRDGGWIFSV